MVLYILHDFCSNTKSTTETRGPKAPKTYCMCFCMNSYSEKKICNFFYFYSRAKSKIEDGSASNSTDVAPDLSIVKVEPSIDDPGLDMYVDVPDDAMIQAQHREHDDESDLELEEASGDWSRDELSNEAGGSDQNNSWYIGQFKGRFTIFFLVLLIQHC